MTEKQLIHLLQNDPGSGIRKVMDLYGGAIKVICRNILRDFPGEDVEEAISDTLVAVWRSVDRFDRTRGTSFKSYCYGIARKTALAKRKEALGEVNVIPLEEDLLFDTSEVENKFDRKEEERILQRTLEKIEEERNEANGRNRHVRRPNRKRKIGLLALAAVLLMGITVSAAEYFHLNQNLLNFLGVTSSEEAEGLEDQGAGEMVIQKDEKFTLKGTFRTVTDMDKVVGVRIHGEDILFKE